jgi:hypothetical protein
MRGAGGGMNCPRPAVPLTPWRAGSGPGPGSGPTKRREHCKASPARRQTMHSSWLGQAAAVSGPGVACSVLLGGKGPLRAAAGGGPVAYGVAGLDARRQRGRGAELSGGRCIMSRSGVFYAVKAMERVAAGTAVDGVPGVPTSRGVVRQASAGARPEGRIFFLVRWVLAGMRPGMGGVAGRAGQGGRRLGRAARAD